MLALPLFAISGLYFVLHHSAAVKPPSGPYARYWDLDMIPTYVRYWGAALAGGQILPHWRLPSWSWEAAAWTLAAILAGFAAFAWRRGERTAALGAFWFTAAIGPVLPLRDHFSVYYLALPAFGLALILGSFLHFAWPRGWRWRAAAAAVIGLHLYFALPIQQATARWHYERGRRVQGLVEGIWRAHELHPGKTILLTGLDDELYWGGFYDAPHRVLGIPEVFLAPGAEKSITPHASLGEIAQTVAPESMAAQELFWDRAVVYQVDGLRLLNITRRYTKNLPPAWLEARPRLIDAGLPAFDRDLGAGWHAREGNYRWMSQSAVVHLAAPDPSADLLFVAGYCPPEQAAKGVNLTLKAGGAVLGTIRTSSANAGFEGRLPLPAGFAPTGEVEVTLLVDRPYREPGGRELGLAFGRIGWVQNQSKDR